ncbi:MAG: ABC transporter permease, partial [Actinomycetota bacterium]
FVLTDSIERAFADLFTKASAGFDVIVRTKASFEGADRDRIPKQVLEEVRVIEGVEVAEGGIDDFAQLIDDDGEPVGGQGPPTLVTTHSGVERTNIFTIADGRFPRREGELALDVATARSQEWKTGDEVSAVFVGPVEKMTLVGTVQIEGIDSLAGLHWIVLELEAAQELYQRGETFDSIAVVAEPGLGERELSQRIAAEIDDRFEVRPRDDFIQETTDQIREGLGFLTNFLLAFAFVALIVGGFLIFNTFSILFAQRIREFAMLRAIGSGRGQLLATVLGEALVIGAVASGAGIGVGILLALGLRRLFAMLGGEIPVSGTPLLPRTILISIVLGLLITLVSAFIPALRATRITPVAGMREGAVLPRRRRRLFNVLALVFGAGGVAALALALFGNPPRRLEVIAGGTIAVFVALTLVSPAVARPVAAVLGWPVSRFLGIRGRLARGNAMRDPTRTAATAAALMIGVALATFAAIMAASFQASTTSNLQDRLKADFMILATSQVRLSSDLAPQLAALSEVDDAVGIKRDANGAEIEGRREDVLGIDPRRIEDHFVLDVVEGDLGEMGDGLLVEEQYANDEGWEVGTVVPVEFPRGEERVRVAGIFRNVVAGTRLLVSQESFQRRFLELGDFRVFVSLAPTVSPAEGREAIERVLRAFPNGQLFDQVEFREEQERELDNLLVLVNGLLGLSLLIAVFGIVNTLALSVIERTREIGLLRAIGLTRRQVRGMIRWESVIVALMGTAFGLSVGSFFGWMMVKSLAEEGLSRFALPGGQVAAYSIGAAVAGVLAAVMPARRAAKVDVLRAIAFE